MYKNKKNTHRFEATQAEAWAYGSGPENNQARALGRQSLTWRPVRARATLGSSDATVQFRTEVRTWTFENWTEVQFKVQKMLEPNFFWGSAGQNCLNYCLIW